MKVTGQSIEMINNLPHLLYEADGKLYIAKELKQYTTETAVIAPLEEIKKMSANGLAFLGLEEGLRLNPYKDAKGVPTIAIGNTYYEDGTKVKMTDPPITQERALKLFSTVLPTYERGVYRVLRDDITQTQFDACVSLCYNIGVEGFRTSTVAELVNANPKDPAITEAFKLWKYSNGKPILLNRRIREAQLYFS